VCIGSRAVLQRERILRREALVDEERDQRVGDNIGRGRLPASDVGDVFVRDIQSHDSSFGRKKEGLWGLTVVLLSVYVMEAPATLARTRPVARVT
jgi:hypothetical protein